MRVGLLSLPLGLFGSIIVIVLVVAIANVLSKSRNTGRTLVAGFAALLAVGLFLLGFLGFFMVGTRTVVSHEAAARTAVLQAQAEAIEAQKQVQAQAAEIQARIENGTTPGDRIMYEDPATHVSQVVVPVIVDEHGQALNVSGPVSRSQDRHGEVSTSHEVSAHGEAGHAAVPVESSSGVTVAGRPWTDAVEEHQDFEADVYPSIENAAEALGRRVGQKLVSTFDTNEKPTPMVYVWRDVVAGNTENQNGEMIVTRELLEAVASGLRQKLQEPAYVSVEQPPTPEDIAVNVAIPEVSFENHNRWRTHAESRSGSIALRVQSPDGPFSISTRFADTPWLTDRTGFVRQYANGDWLVAYSDGTDSTHEGAREDALHAATDVLLPLAQSRISQLPASDQHRFAQQMAKDPSWLRDRVSNELVSRNLVTDRFAQRFDRSYGTVWREAVLVNASPTRVEEIARSLVQGVDAKVSYQRNTWFSFFALAGLIFGTYLFLNMATKGYYAWMLRLAALGGVAAAGFLVMHLF
ncbi:MAG: hypothetical protein R3C45_17530 [Phycisphaerales bacterium]